MKFYADENVNDFIIRSVRSRGLDIINVSESFEQGIPDKIHLKKAKNKERVIITADDDFLAFEQDFDHYGIIFISKQEISVGKASKKICKIAEEIDKDQMRDHVEFI